MERNKQKRILILVFVCGLLIMSYPLYSTAINNVWDTMTMRRYMRQEHNRFEAQKEVYREQNELMSKNGIVPGSDPFGDGEGILSTDRAHEHFLGSITFPKLRLEVPLYDKTNNALLEIGATVLDGTSMPLGGTDSHSVITAHRGLPNRELFTNIGKLVEKDIFVIDVFGEKIAYEVSEISVVLPHETEGLKIVEGGDLVTLVTCTPYMINSHRLLVTGTRTVLTEEMSDEVVKRQNEGNYINYGIISLLALIVLGTPVVIYIIKRNDRHQ